MKEVKFLHAKEMPENRARSTRKNNSIVFFPTETGKISHNLRQALVKNRSFRAGGPISFSAAGGGGAWLPPESRYPPGSNIFVGVVDPPCRSCPLESYTQSRDYSHSARMSSDLRFVNIHSGWHPLLRVRMFPKAGAAAATPSSTGTRGSGERYLCRFFGEM